MRYGPRGKLEERFWKFVTKTDTCWNWNGHVGANGYAKFRILGKYKCVHRVAYELINGPIPPGLTLDHLCRNRKCVNPEHLEPVTNRENILRGTGITAQEAHKTHCLRGHEFTPENIIRIGDGRKCKTCNRKYQREWMRAYSKRRRDDRANQDTR